MRATVMGEVPEEHMSGARKPKHAKRDTIRDGWVPPGYNEDPAEPRNFRGRICAYGDYAIVQMISGAR